MRRELTPIMLVLVLSGCASTARYQSPPTLGEAALAPCERLASEWVAVQGKSVGASIGRGFAGGLQAGGMFGALTTLGAGGLGALIFGPLGALVGTVAEPIATTSERRALYDEVMAECVQPVALEASLGARDSQVAESLEQLGRRYAGVADHHAGRDEPAKAEPFVRRALEIAAVLEERGWPDRAEQLRTRVREAAEPFYVEPDLSDEGVARLDGPEGAVFEIDGKKVQDAGGVRLVPGDHTISYRWAFGGSVLLGPPIRHMSRTGVVRVEAGHVYLVKGNREGHWGSPTLYLWIEDAASGEVVDGIRSPAP
jgi:hypothetical protein